MTFVIIGMMNLRALGIAVLLATVLAACEGSDAAPKDRRAEPQPNQSTQQTTTTTSPLDQYNTTHDPSVCVKLNPDGTVRITNIKPAPDYDPSKMDPAVYGKCG
jgi:hypothetical protein